MMSWLANRGRRIAGEISSELRGVLGRRAGVLDGALPPLVFVLAVNVAGTTAAAAIGGGLATVTVLWRLIRRERIRFAVSGLGATAFALLLALRSGEARNYFLPGIITAGLTAVAVVISILAKRPFAAWASWITRGWPLDWYWHPRVRPAYTAVSWGWAGFFGARAGIQWGLYAANDLGGLGVARLVIGWPGFLLLLIVSYLVGRHRLEALQGPSVAEYEAGEPPPWSGQQVGF